VEGDVSMAGSLIDRIDQAFVDLPDLRSGTDPYRRRLDEEGLSVDEPPPDVLRRVVVDVAAEAYCATAIPPVDLVEFSDGAFDVLFDVANELTVLVHGFSRQVPPNTRDRNYHRGYPGRPGFDRGHAMAHAHGGLEGGPNYFPQAPRVNRRLSPLGALWRDIESHLAKHPGLFCFVRLGYEAQGVSDVPVEVEYGIQIAGCFRVVVFPND
jgi:hypothetical protein